MYRLRTACSRSCRTHATSENHDKHVSPKRNHPRQQFFQCTPAYTADVSRSATYGESLQITGNITVANSGTAVTGFGAASGVATGVAKESVTGCMEGDIALSRLLLLALPLEACSPAWWPDEDL